MMSDRKQNILNFVKLAFCDFLTKERSSWRKSERKKIIRRQTHHDTCSWCSFHTVEKKASNAKKCLGNRLLSHVFMTNSSGCTCHWPFTTHSRFNVFVIDCVTFIATINCDVDDIFSTVLSTTNEIGFISFIALLHSASNLLSLQI